MFVSIAANSFIWLVVFDSSKIKHNDTVLVCTDLSGKEPHRVIGVDRMVTSGSQRGKMVSALAVDYCSPRDTRAMIRILSKVVESTMYIMYM